MKVAFVDQSSQMGGVEYTTLRVAENLDKEKFEPLIICPSEGPLPRMAREAGLQVRVLPSPKQYSVSIQWNKRYFFNPIGFLISAINIFRTVHNLIENLQVSPVDVIITKGLIAHFYGGIASLRLKIPCIWYVQEEVDAKRAGGLFIFLFRQFAKILPTKIIVDAKALLDQFSGISRGDNFLHVISNGINLKEFRAFTPQEKIDAKRFFNINENLIVIGQSGRIIPLKGQDVLIDAFATIAQIYPKTHLLIVGAPLFSDNNYENLLHKIVKDYGLTERVTFTGFLPDVKLGLAAMDIFVNASTETDSPISILEAMACELAVVVSKVRGTEDMVDPGLNGLTFEPGNSTVLAHQLKKIVDSMALRNKLRVAARRSIIQRHSLQKSVIQMQELLEGLNGD